MGAQPLKHKAVVFDLFGTLIENFTTDGYNQVLADMAGAVRAPVEAFRRAWWATVDDRMTGRCGGMTENILRVSDDIGIHPSPEQVAHAVELRLDFTRRCFTPRPGALDMLERLKSSGLKLGLISDCTAEVPELWETAPLAPFMDTAVFSCSEGVRKPDPRIYRLACDRLGVATEDCLYVGDGSSRELSGAQEAGMHPVLITGPEIDLAGVDRADATRWNGPVITALPQVLEVVL